MDVDCKPGDLVAVREADYQYGTGTLTLRITEIGPMVPVGADGEWREVCGIEIGWDGERRGQRRVRVRPSALTRAALR